LINKCTLCSAVADFFYQGNQKKYYSCRNCLAIFLDPGMHLSSEDEKKRYEEHNNDVNDIRYQKFVEPIVSQIEKKFNKEHTGLDFGAGPGPVITKMLRDKGFNILLYDPFFFNIPELLQNKYDYIACCEVIEHFHNPAREFGLLKSLLKPGGSLYCMTEIYRDDVEFGRWYYKNDSTHVFFYHTKTLEWIKVHLHFQSMNVEGRLIQFTV
jgi:SAM-dependent methyltransferase